MYMKFEVNRYVKHIQWEQFLKLGRTIVVSMYSLVAYFQLLAGLSAVLPT